MSSSPCAACKFLRRKCTPECVFAPYFPADQAKKFTDVHKVFGASNVSKILNEIDAMHREDAVQSLAYEADARIRDPVYGCVGQISLMQQTLSSLRSNLENSRRELASLVGPENMVQIMQDPVLLARYGPPGMAAMANFASSSNGNLMAMDPRLDPQQQYKLLAEQQRLEKMQQEQFQLQQRQQIGAHIMQQMLEQSERHHKLKQQQQLIQQQQGGRQQHKQLLLDRQMQVREQQKLNGGQLVMGDTAQQQAQALAALQAREEQEMFKSYEEMHKEAQMYVMQQQREAQLLMIHEEQQRQARIQDEQQRQAQVRRFHAEQREAQLVRFQEEQIRAQMEGGTHGNAEMSPLLALGSGFGAMNPYQQQGQSLLNPYQQQEQPLLNPYHVQQQGKPSLLLQQPQQQQQQQEEIIHIPDDDQPPDQQQQQEESHDIQALFPDHNLQHPVPENGG